MELTLRLKQRNNQGENLCNYMSSYLSLTSYTYNIPVQSTVKILWGRHSTVSSFSSLWQLSTQTNKNLNYFKNYKNALHNVCTCRPQYLSKVRTDSVLRIYIVLLHAQCAPMPKWYITAVNRQELDMQALVGVTAWSQPSGIEAEDRITTHNSHSQCQT